MDNECNEETFLKNVKDHELNIIKDDGVYRHLRFKKATDSITYYFDLITWKGYLTITGDMGTYVFSRVDDMFTFFRTDNEYKKNNPDRKLFINPSYWGEKVQSIDCRSGFKEFDLSSFLDRVKGYLDDYKETHTEDEFEELMEEVKDRIYYYVDNEDESILYNAVNDFSFKDFYFTDFFDGGATDKYTYHYIWCLYAIVWGINVYDKVKKTINN